jgi:hypothetical protein
MDGMVVVNSADIATTPAPSWTASTKISDPTSSAASSTKRHGDRQIRLGHCLSQQYKGAFTSWQ